MFQYSVKRIVRGRGMFLSLFVSVALATTLFAGILQGADAIGAKSLEQIFRSAPYDVIDQASAKNITKTRILEVEEVLGSIEGVTHIDKFIWAPVNAFEPGSNETVEGIFLVAIPDNSTFYESIQGVDRFERGKVYLDVSSFMGARWPWRTPPGPSSSAGTTGTCMACSAGTTPPRGGPGTTWF